ncbi:hypothetical protein [Brevibacillus sp. SIMBA_040]|uniref:hypothetical protein n=1 Tax=unclassified Brevibacillus TaxID=2684853 RepID=UPI00397AECE7
MNHKRWSAVVFGGALLMSPANCLAAEISHPVEAASCYAIHRLGEGEQKPNRYEVAGITNPAAFEAFFGQLQQAVKRGDKNKVAKHVKYPLRVNKEGASRFVHDEEQFLTEYDQIMTGNVRQALLQQNVTNTFVNAQGVMVGDGELWLGQFGSEFGIFAINL